MNVPGKFKLMGQTIVVIYDPTLTNVDSSVGQARYRLNTIVLQPDTIASPRTTDQIEHTFWHEVTHHILNAMSENELAANEKFVDVFSGLLHQVAQTMEYEDEDKSKHKKPR